MTLATQAFRPGGSTGKADALKYDAWNRLVEYKDDDSGAVLQKNEYDGLGQRIVRSVGGGSPATHDYYYNDQWQPLTEVKGSAVEAIYQWHPFYIDALAVRMRASDTHFFLQDANFNVTAAVDDSTNAVVERYSYSPYGQVTVLNPDFSLDSVGGDGLSDIGNNHLYTGRERDGETGLQLNRNRYYAAHLGRWVNRDPILYRGGMNLYGYIEGRPTYYVDPYGLWLGWPSWDDYVHYLWNPDDMDDGFQIAQGAALGVAGAAIGGGVGTVAGGVVGSVVVSYGAPAAAGAVVGGTVGGSVGGTVGSAIGGITGTETGKYIGGVGGGVIGGGCGAKIGVTPDAPPPQFKPPGGGGGGGNPPVDLPPRPPGNALPVEPPVIAA